MTETVKRVLIVGAGRRVANNFLPALTCLADQFRIVGLQATSRVRAEPLGALWKVPAFTELTDELLGAADIVAISVPTSANADVLNKLRDHAARLHIVIDTPIAWNRRQLWRTWNVLKLFPKVTVAEDYMNFPPFELARRVAFSGLLGSLKSAELRNIGYLYHGLALIRSLNGFAKIRASRRSRQTHGQTVHYTLDSGFRADVVGPYERSGRLTLVGEKASLTYDDLRPKETQGSGEILIRSAHDGLGEITGFETHGGGDFGAVHTQIAAMRSMPFEDKSQLNLLRGSGLAAVFRSVSTPDGLNSRYGPKNAIYDGVASRMAESGRLSFDPLRVIGWDLPSALRSAHFVSRAR
jgi:predicted dehydrogenase